jgi:hypothetical protein
VNLSRRVSSASSTRSRRSRPNSAPSPATADGYAVCRLANALAKDVCFAHRCW